MTTTSGNGQVPSRRRSTHPYRDSALAYAVLGGVVFLIAWLTGSPVLKALAGGGGAFVLATAYTWWRMRARERQRDRERR
jgi:hypothetical protein